MSVAARMQRRWSVPWVAFGVIVAVTVAATATALALIEPPSVTSSRASAVVAEQIPWRIISGVRGKGASRTKSVRNASVGEKQHVATLVKALYDGMFLERDISSVIPAHFARPAAQKLQASSFGWPAAAERIRLTKRQARIAVHLEDGARGVATVKVGGKARTEDGWIRIFHRATLWLEKSDRGWQVIAFDAVQERTK